MTVNFKFVKKQLKKLSNKEKDAFLAFVYIFNLKGLEGIINEFPEYYFHHLKDDRHNEVSFSPLGRENSLRLIGKINKDKIFIIFLITKHNYKKQRSKI